MQEPLLVIIVVVPLLAALLIPLLGRVWRGAGPWMTIGALGVSVYAAAQILGKLWGADADAVLEYHMGGHEPPFGIPYVVDRLNAIVLAMVATMGLLTAIWMRAPLEKEIDPKKHTSFWAVFLLCVTGYLGITITGDVFNLYVFLEIASITTYVLIAMGTGRRALYAGFSYLIVGSIGATFILLGIGHLYMATGSLAMTDIATYFANDPNLYDSSVIRTSFAFFSVGLALKMALFPLHGWQPNAYASAPSGASLFIAGTATKVSAYAAYRLSFSVFGLTLITKFPIPYQDGLLVMAASAIVVGPLLAIRQPDLKRLLAYSSVGQIGYVMLGLVLMNQAGLTGGIAHFWNHAAAKGALFCVAGALVYRTGAARVEDLAGMGRRAPWTAATMTVAGCSMVGVPLTAGFLSKFYLSVGAIEAGRWIIVPVLLLSSLFTAIYVWRLCQLVWFAPADVEPKVEREVPWSMRLPALVMGAACLVFGIFPIGVELARQAAEALLS